MLYKITIIFCVVIINALLAQNLNSQNCMPEITKNYVKFGNNKIKIIAKLDHAIYVKKWGRVIIIRSKQPELICSIYDECGNKIGPDHSVLGKIFVLERMDRIVLAYTNNEYNVQPTVIINKNNKIIKYIKIDEPIVDWFHSEDGKLMWLFTPNEYKINFFNCRVFDFNGHFVEAKEVKAGDRFDVQYDNTTYMIQINIKTIR